MPPLLVLLPVVASSLVSVDTISGGSHGLPACPLQARLAQGLVLGTPVVGYQLESQEANSEVCHWVCVGPPHGLAVYLPLHLGNDVHHGLLGDQSSLLQHGHLAHKVAIEA